MTTTETTMTVRQIKAAFDALSGVFNTETTNYAERLLAQCREEERGHRGFMDGFSRCHTADTIGVADAARLFAVKRVAEYLTDTSYPKGREYLHTQQSCFIAAGIADEFDAEVRKAWSDFDVDALAALNYTDYVHVRATA